jgi:NTE family protein
MNNTPFRVSKSALFFIFSLWMAARPTAAQIAPPMYRNLVFEGGGVRGMAYVGALRVLEERRILADIQRVGGTSVGAITALLLALGYTPDEMETVLMTLNIGQFNDGRWLFVGGFARTSRRYGWYRGERFERWLETLITRKTGNPNLTFAQLHKLRTDHPGTRDLYVTGTNLTAQQSVVFSHEYTPDMLLKTAVRISMSVPLYFGAVFLDEKNRPVQRPKRGESYQIFVDGGLTANYPIALFDTNGVVNRQTLGLKLERPEQLRPGQPADVIAPYTIHSLADYVSAFYNYALENLNRHPALETGRTIYISTEGITPRVRRMTNDQRNSLINSGKRGTTLFFE